MGEPEFPVDWDQFQPIYYISICISKSWFFDVILAFFVSFFVYILCGNHFSLILSHYINTESANDPNVRCEKIQFLSIYKRVRRKNEKKFYFFFEKIFFSSFYNKFFFRNNKKILILIKIVSKNESSLRISSKKHHLLKIISNLKQNTSLDINV